MARILLQLVVAAVVDISQDGREALEVGAEVGVVCTGLMLL
jgi:hypothetical protein